MAGDNPGMIPGVNNYKEKPQPGKIESQRVLVLSIYIQQPSGKIEIEGLIGEKVLCLQALGEAVKTVAAFEAPKLIQARPSFMTGLRNTFHRK